MPLIACPDCKKEVSGSAEQCPHCGAPIYFTEEKLTQAGKGVFILGGLVGLVLLGMWIWESASEALEPKGEIAFEFEGEVTSARISYSNAHLGSTVEDVVLPKTVYVEGIADGAPLLADATLKASDGEITVRIRDRETGEVLAEDTKAGANATASVFTFWSAPQ